MISLGNSGITSFAGGFDALRGHIYGPENDFDLARLRDQPKFKSDAYDLAALGMMARDK
jgi:hypothetical protein